MANLVDAAMEVVLACARRDFPAVYQNADKMFTSGLSEFVLAESWTMVIRAAGEFQGIESVRSYRFMLGPVRAVFVVCRFERMTVEAEVSFTNEDKLLGLIFMTPM